MDTLFQDLKFGLRAMLKSPGFSIVAVLTLALGIGANTAIFSVVNATMIRPLPYADAARLVRVFHSYPKLNMPTGVTVSPAYFAYYRDNAMSFESLAAGASFKAPQNLTGSGDPQKVETVTTTWNLFELLGARPMLGRTFVAQEDQPGNSRVAVLSYGLWQRRFGGEQSIIGRPITLDGADYTVVGVMPKGFEYPNEAELWVPIAFTPRELNSGTEYLNVVGKLRPGVSLAQANAELEKISQDLINRDNEGRNEMGWHVYSAPMREAEVGDVRTAIIVLLAAVGCVMLIACANVANLLLARASARQKEIAIRGALGASRWRTFRQLVTEGLLLSLLGGVCGLALGYWGLSLLLSAVPIRIPGFIRVQIDPVVMAFTFLLAILTGVLFSAAPAFQLSKHGLHLALKEGGRTSTAGGRHALRSGIIIAELAVSLVLLIGAGLLIKSFIRIQQADPGFNPSNLLMMNVTLPEAKYPEEKQPIFFSKVLDRVSTLPGVPSVAVTSGMPLQGGMTSSFSIEGKEFRVAPHAHVATISPKYFEALQIPVLNGRVFAETDLANSQPVAILDTKAASAYFPGENAIGKRVMFTFEGAEKKRVWREIVGVVGSVKHNSPIANETKGQVFIPYTQLPMPFMTLAVRTGNDPKAMVAAVRREIQQVDPTQPIQRVRTMEEALSEFVSQPRFNMLLLGSFAVLALVLSAVGIYGVMAYSVTQRTREIGVRMALGAQRGDVLKMVLKEALRLAAVGLLIGLVGSLIATRVLSTLLFGVKTTDPTTFLGISFLLALFAAAASYIPARRATRVDPNVALRYE